MPSILAIIWNNKFDLPPLPAPNTLFFLRKIHSYHWCNVMQLQYILSIWVQDLWSNGGSLAKGELAKTRIEDETSTIGKNIVRCMEAITDDLTARKCRNNYSLVHTVTCDSRLDMSTFETINEFAGKVTEDIQEIDFVCLYAGAISANRKLGKEGYKTMIEISVLGTSFLALLLLPWMKEVGRGNAHLGIVTKTSTFPSGRNMDVLKYWSAEENWKDGQSGYALAKLLQQYAVNEIAKLALSADGKHKVIVNSICPGYYPFDLIQSDDFRS
ncbi:uncharacterized protein EAE98_008137 [Botrytis deweyae]|uniref:Ketoreductase (KR) domain-containing protein n=1 Tax=Botrytis deweyae TaxID=2478750 RepID=A0ABQ7IG37_9HELO|nr:uncharacterized protein EAE98_008137 [Botrytis deweyae]KAF7922611.1 hypothetical protein EAE98_008137 [Botrytis deweyae]